MLSRVYSCTVIGVNSFPIEVEVDVARGLPQLSIVGLPDNAVRESKQRVISAIKNCSYDFPPKKITVNLAPAAIRKEGAGFDLPIALGILLANGSMSCRREGKFCIVGELSLDGSLRHVRGAFSMALGAMDHGFNAILLPAANSQELAILQGKIEIIPLQSLQQAAEFLALEDDDRLVQPFADTYQEAIAADDLPLDYTDIHGQQDGKRGLEIAASGGHNLLFSGSPGSGKSMMAKRLPTILPPMTHDEMLETQKIYSVSAKEFGKKRNPSLRPFRAPHHNVSDAGLVGGGVVPQPGEVSLAHNGVLFLDELPEFKRRVLEMLRQPLENGEVTIARANMTLCFPSRFILIAAMNPCPCGYLGDPRNLCSCHEGAIARYKQQISGPLLDRIDMFLHLQPLSFSELHARVAAENSAQIRERVEGAREIQDKRFAELKGIYCNAQMDNRLIKEHCSLGVKASRLLEDSFSRLGFTGRSYQKILKTSRTIADLAHSGTIKTEHLAEAIHFYRSQI